MKKEGRRTALRWTAPDHPSAGLSLTAQNVFLSLFVLSSLWGSSRGILAAVQGHFSGVSMLGRVILNKSGLNPCDVLALFCPILPLDITPTKNFAFFLPSPAPNFAFFCGIVAVVQDHGSPTV